MYSNLLGKYTALPLKNQTSSITKWQLRQYKNINVQACTIINYIEEALKQEASIGYLNNLVLL